MSEVPVYLYRELDELKEADIGAIEKDVGDACFSCVRCQKCCKGAYGDNTVAVSPREIRAIVEATGLDWLNVSAPSLVGDYDVDGVYHAFGWSLRKKPDGDCIFLDRSGLCSIYSCRPWICRTYPFRYGMDGVETYECDGLCQDKPDDTRPMAIALKCRSIAEAEEAIDMLRRFEEFSPSERPVTGPGKCVVHDGEGSRRLLVKDDTFEFY